MTAAEHLPTTTLQHALGYAARGLRVLPIIPGHKRPPMGAWQDAATTDPDTITAWFTGLYRDHGVGIATGRESGIFALDVDQYDSYRDLERAHQPLPDTLTNLTGSGGMHLVYRYPTGRTIRNSASTKLGPGLDIRGDGGQIVAPPTIHPNGTAYEWDAGQGDDIVDAPDWLLDLICDEPRATTPLSNPGPTGDRPGDLYADAVDWATILTADGWTLHHTDRNGERHWTRPGKEVRDGTSATTGYTANDNLKVFTSSMQHLGLDPEGVYTKLGYIAATRHQGDHAAAARSLADHGFRTSTTTTPPAVDTVTAEPTADDHGGWEWVDLGTILDGTYDPPTPTIGARSDGTNLIYPGRVHSIAGEPGGGKTWLALHLIAETIANGGRAALIDYEDTPGATVNRLRLLGVSDAQIRSQFDYVRPDGPLVTKGGKVAAHTLDRLAQMNADLVVIDSVGESLAVEGLPPNDDDAVAQWFRRLPRMLARQGAAVVGLDHVTKSKDDRGRWAIGSQRKLAAIDGAAYGVDVKSAPTKTRDGKLTITCAKDRHGTFQAGNLVANVGINNVADGVRVTVTAPDAKFRPTHFMEQVSRFLEEIPSASQRGILSGIHGRDSYKKAALECLVEEGYVRCDTTQRGHQYVSVTAFRDVEPVDNHTAATAATPRPPEIGRGPEDPSGGPRPPRPDPTLTGGSAWPRSPASGGDETPPDQRERGRYADLDIDPTDI